MASVSHDPYCENQRFTEHKKKPKFFLLFPLLFKEINKRRISPRLPETLFFFVCYLNLEKIFENINKHRCTVVKRKQTNVTHMPRELFFFFFFSPCIGTASSRGWIFVLWWIFFFTFVDTAPKVFPLLPSERAPALLGQSILILMTLSVSPPFNWPSSPDNITSGCGRPTAKEEVDVISSSSSSVF